MGFQKMNYDQITTRNSIQRLEKICKNSKAVVIKTIRSPELSYIWGEMMGEKEEEEDDIRYIRGFRNPIEIYNSRTKLCWDTSVGKMESICENMRKDREAILRNQMMMNREERKDCVVPPSTLQVEFDVLVNSTYQVAKSAYEFIDLPLNNDTWNRYLLNGRHKETFVKKCKQKKKNIDLEEMMKIEKCKKK